MSGYISKILNNSISSLSAQQGLIATTSSNISNVNTPGYSRRIVQVETRGGGNTTGLNLGNGVELGELQRQTSSFLENLLRSAVSDTKGSEVEDEFMSRLEGLFSLQGGTNTIGSALNGFFAAVDDLSVNPSSIELRANFIERANDLVNSIRDTYNTLASLQDEADRRIASEVDSVNSLCRQIADINGRIRTAEASGTLAPDERDQRDALLQKLSEKVTFKVVEAGDGTVNVTLTNGFPLVSSTVVREIEVSRTPSFASGTLPPSLSGGQLNYIVYDFSNGGGTGHIDLSETIAEGNGTLGGLLAVRGTNAASNTSAFSGQGVLIDIAARVESVARVLLTTVNRINVGDDNLDGSTDRDPATPAFFDPTSGDLDGNSPASYGLFSFTYAGNADTDNNGLADDLGTHGVDSYASRLKLTITNPRQVAAARDSSAGAPAAATFAPGDGRNLEAISALQNRDLTFVTGTHSLTANFGAAYDETVSTVGNLRNRSKVNLSVAAANQATAQSQRDEVAAVSLDEEFANLIKFQRSFEASARLIKIADQLLIELLQVI